MPVTTVSPARRAALAVLAAVRRGRRLDRALATAAAGLPSRDRRWLHEATYGVSRLRGRLDHLLDAQVHRGIDGVSPPLRDVLRLGAYQLLYMDGVPPYAAVSEAVDQARGVARGRAVSLVNAVLRALAARRPSRDSFPDPSTDPVGYLSTWGSHPRWLVERWLARWPFAEVAALVEANNQVPPVFLRPIGISGGTAQEALEEAGIAVAPAGADCLRLQAAGDVARALATVPSVVQDPAAALVTRYAAPAPGSVVADLCAAPGGKALAMSETAAYVVAADRSLARLSLLREAVHRLQARVGVVAALAERPPIHAADLVLLDVPCTGTGTLRRHPDARWRLRPGHVAALAGVQRRILEGAERVVRPGGVLVYATCSLEPEENEEQVHAFLSLHPEYRPEPGSGVEPGLLDAAGRLNVLPQRSGCDGAFAARLRRVA